MTAPDTQQPPTTGRRATTRVGGWAKRIFGWLASAVLFLLCFLLLITVAYPMVRGYVPLTILSGSMDPTYPVGSQVFVEPIESPEAAAENVKVGSAITFMPLPDDPTLITHRVVAVAYKTDGSPVYTTQGDANNTPDEAKVGLTQLRGVVRYHVPWIGYIATSMTQDRKDSLAVVFAAGLFTYAGWNIVLAARERRRRKSIEVREKDAA